MQIQRIGTVAGGQDGAIFGKELFRLDHRGSCRVYDLSPLEGGGVPAAIGDFVLDRADLAVPHSNAVCFGVERYAIEDRYPLLYTNIYNNCASAAEPYLGTCCVYRILREGDRFSAHLVQLITVDFCEDSDLWRASPEGHGVRPFGNFLVDTDTHSYYAYVMRSEPLGTRFFRFDLPSVIEGEIDPVLNVRRVMLRAEDIREHFDMPFYRFIQGGIIHGGILYSTEGFDKSPENPPAIRRVDLKKHTETYHDLPSLGIWEEPEMIDFCGDTCYYSDAGGHLYTVVF